MSALLLQEIMSSALMMHPSSLGGLELLVKKIQSGEQFELDKLPALSYDGYKEPEASLSHNPYDSLEENSIAVLPITGMMRKYGVYSPWTESYYPGMDDIAYMLRLADESTKVIGSILCCNTPGGSSQSVMQLEDALRNRTKPCVGFIDGSCFSGGTYVLSFCDKIVAANPMCMIGNVGVYVQLVNEDKAYERYGISFVSVYPPESKYKNLAYMEAKNGNTQMLIEEQLSPFAIHFQNIMKQNRPNLDLSVEGLLEGKDFYAQDAISNGLIDGITNFDGAAKLIKELHNEKESIYSPFKKQTK